MVVDNLFENGGKVISLKMVFIKVNRVIVFINMVLLYLKELKLVKYYFLNVNDDFWLDILMKYVEYGSF